MDKTQVTIKAYNQNAKAYIDKFMDYPAYNEQVIAFSKLLSEGSRVLDIGCGPGNVARQLYLQKSVQITGIDLSEEMIKTAQKTVQGTFFTQDMRLASFPREAFDAVVLSFSIVHLSDVEAYKLLGDAVDWLAPGGFFYLSFMEGKKAGFEKTSFSDQLIFFNYYSSNKIEAALNKLGLSIIRYIKQDYKENDGSITTDVFIFGKKNR